MDNNKIPKAFRRNKIIAIVAIGTIVGAIDGFFVSKMGMSLYKEILTNTVADAVFGKTVAIFILCGLLWCMYFIAAWAIIMAINAITDGWLLKTLNKLLMKMHKM